MRAIEIFLCAALIFCASPAAAQVTRMVDDDGAASVTSCDDATPAATRIGDAIAAAATGNVILVCPGLYRENINFAGKAIALRSVAGAAATIVEGNATGPVVTFASFEGPASVLEGFTVRNGFAEFPVTRGGGVRIQNASPVLRDNVIAGNHACEGGGVSIAGGAPLLEGNTIRNNSAGCSGPFGLGGGIAVTGSGFPTIRRNTIAGNTATGGGGVAFDSFPLGIIERNVISGNVASFGGGISVENGAAPTIADNVVVGNRAGVGGGMEIIVPFGATAPVVISNTVADNHSLFGSGVVVDGFDGTVHLTHNSITALPGQIALLCRDLTAQVPIVTFNNVFSAGGSAYGGNCTDQTGLNGNISADPSFVNAAGGDYHLRGGSPNIDAGTSDLSLSAFDIDGERRVMGDAGGFARADIGADEYAGPQIVQVDVPNGGTVGTSFRLSGWAIDARSLGTGLDAVHVYAHPDGGGAPIFLGVADYGLPRADVAAIYGSRFRPSGFTLTTSGVLHTGGYLVVAYARSRFNQAFELAGSAHITVGSLPILVIDSPASAPVTPVFRISGWAVDLGTSGGTGVDTVHAYAFPEAGGIVFLGAATYGQPRPDVAAALGADQFALSGWSLDATLPPGKYLLAVYARSVVSGVFDKVAVRDLRVVPSQPRVVIDTRLDGGPFPQPLTISGWAIDLGSTSTPGIDAVHAYLFPHPGSGEAPIFVGAAEYGAPRPDVAAAFGGAQFTNCGYTFTINGVPPGIYVLAVYARSTASGVFDGVAQVLMSVTIPQ